MCNAEFIRISYLYKHLQFIHKYTITEARSKALYATTANCVTKTCDDTRYEGFSSDDDILNVFEKDMVQNFDISLLNSLARVATRSEEDMQEDDYRHEL
jgi:hypothetical protein